MLFFNISDVCLRCAATHHCEDLAQPLAGLPSGMDQHALISHTYYRMRWNMFHWAPKPSLEDYLMRWRTVGLTCANLAYIMHESWAPVF